MPIKVTYQNPGLEYDENMVCEDFLNMGMLPLETYRKLWKITILMGKSTISMAMFNSHVSLPEGISSASLMILMPCKKKHGHVSRRCVKHHLSVGRWSTCSCCFSKTLAFCRMCCFQFQLLHVESTFSKRFQNPISLLVGGLEHVLFFHFIYGMILPIDFHMFQDG